MHVNNRVTTLGGLKILMIEDNGNELKYHTRIIVYKEAFNNLHQQPKDPLTIL